METRILWGANRNRLVLAIALCVGLFSISRDVSAGQGSLDGKTFVVETGEKGKSGGDKDTLTFKYGSFRSAGCDQYGFGDGAYTSSVIRIAGVDAPEKVWLRQDKNSQPPWEFR